MADRPTQTSDGGAEHPPPICPFCGEQRVAPPSTAATGSPEPCRVCGRVDDAIERQRVQNGMGPWFIRESTRAAEPGRSYETMLAAIARRDVGLDTIVRGPSTRQFWVRARRAPGLAHKLGVCHACDAPVPPGAEHCPRCDADFVRYADRRDLGLAPIRPLPDGVDPDAVAEALLAGESADGVSPHGEHGPHAILHHPASDDRTTSEAAGEARAERSPDSQPTPTRQPSAPICDRSRRHGRPERPDRPEAPTAAVASSGVAAPAGLRDWLGPDLSRGLEPPANAAEYAKRLVLERRLIRARIALVALAVALAATLASLATLGALDRLLHDGGSGGADVAAGTNETEPTDDDAGGPIRHRDSVATSDDDAGAGDAGSATREPSGDRTPPADDRTQARSSETDVENESERSPSTAASRAEPRDDAAAPSPPTDRPPAPDSASRPAAEPDRWPIDAPAEPDRDRVEAALRRSLAGDPADLEGALSELEAVIATTRERAATQGRPAPPLPILTAYAADLRVRLTRLDLQRALDG